MSIFTRANPAAHTLGTYDAIVSEEEIAAANERNLRASMALTHVAAQLPLLHFNMLTRLAYLGYEVGTHLCADGTYLIWLPAASEHNINTADGIPVVWSGGEISPRDWIAIDPATNMTYGERITAALLDAKGVR